MTRRQFMLILDRHLWRWLWRGVAVVIVISAVRSSIGDWNEVPSRSMMPTIVPGDRILVDKLAYDLKLPFTTYPLARWGDPGRNDIVVLVSPSDPGSMLVKRIVGIPGDHILGRGEAIPPDRYFVEGDNRAHSFDSRQFGLVERRRIVGRATRVLFSLDPRHPWRPAARRFFESIE